MKEKQKENSKNPFQSKDFENPAQGYSDMQME